MWVLNVHGERRLPGGAQANAELWGMRRLWGRGQGRAFLAEGLTGNRRKVGFDWSVFRVFRLAAVFALWRRGWRLKVGE